MFNLHAVFLATVFLWLSTIDRESVTQQ